MIKRRSLVSLGLVLGIVLRGIVLGAGLARARDADIIISQKADVETFDPAQSNNTSTHNVTINVFDTLVRLSDDGKDFVGELAESWKLMDQTTWQFKLRHGIKDRKSVGRERVWISGAGVVCKKQGRSMRCD